MRRRRTGILCCHFLRNLAFYRSFETADNPAHKHQFWVNARGNFFDIAVLEWCKLFADFGGQHAYEKVIARPECFKKILCEELGIAVEHFAVYVQQMKRYRDKFLAHLDEDAVADLPNLELAKSSASFLYEYLLIQEADTDIFFDAPKSATTVFDSYLNLGFEAQLHAPFRNILSANSV